MRLVLPFCWLYSCLVQSAAASSVAAMRGVPSPQPAPSQAANEAFMICSVVANETFDEASFWIE